MEGGELARFFRAMGMGGEEETAGLMAMLGCDSLDLQVLMRARYTLFDTLETLLETL